MSESYIVDGVTFKVDPLTFVAVPQKPSMIEVSQLWIIEGILREVEEINGALTRLSGAQNYDVHALLTQPQYIFAGWQCGTALQLKWTEVLAMDRWDAVRARDSARKRRCTPCSDVAARLL